MGRAILLHYRNEVGLFLGAVSCPLVKRIFCHWSMRVKLCIGMHPQTKVLDLPQKAYKWKKVHLYNAIR